MNDKEKFDRALVIVLDEETKFQIHNHQAHEAVNFKIQRKNYLVRRATTAPTRAPTHAHAHARMHVHDAAAPLPPAHGSSRAARATSRMS